MQNWSEKRIGWAVIFFAVQAISLRWVKADTKIETFNVDEWQNKQCQEPHPYKYPSIWPSSTQGEVNGACFNESEMRNAVSVVRTYADQWSSEMAELKNKIDRNGDGHELNPQDLKQMNRLNYLFSRMGSHLRQFNEMKPKVEPPFADKELLEETSLPSGSFKKTRIATGVMAGIA